MPKSQKSRNCFNGCYDSSLPRNYCKEHDGPSPSSAVGQDHADAAVVGVVAVGEVDDSADLTGVVELDRTGD